MLRIKGGSDLSVILLNDNWSFHKENENAETISIPHTYNAVDGQNGTSMWRGKGFYTNEFTLTESDLEQDIYLEVGAASMISIVSINNQKIHTNTCPYSLYRVALNDFVSSGINRITIVTDNSPTDAVYPQMADFSMVDSTEMFELFVHPNYTLTTWMEVVTVSESIRKN